MSPTCHTRDDLPTKPEPSALLGRATSYDFVLALVMLQFVPNIGL